MAHQCFFKSKYKDKCPNKEQCKSSDIHRFTTAIVDIIQVSRLCQIDDIHVQLHEELDANNNLVIFFHEDCLKRYTHQCIFKFKYGLECPDLVRTQSSVGRARIDSILRASAIYNDDLCGRLNEELEKNKDLVIHYHKKCVSSYATISNTKWSEQKPRTVEPKKKVRRSLVPFDFKTQCIYCGGHCEIEKDPKNPSRWKPAYLYRTTKSKTNKPNKEFLLEKCDQRNDEWGEQVKIRLEGAVSDLYAADTRYHHNCMQRFLAGRCSLEGELHLASKSETNGDAGFKYIIQKLEGDKSKIWNSVELFEEYKTNGGALQTRKYLLSLLEDYFAGELLILNCSGYASILTFKASKTSHILLVKDPEEDQDLDHSISVVANHVVKETLAIPTDRSKYKTDLKITELQQQVSHTLLRLLSSVSKDLGDECLPALMIGHMITSVLKHQSTILQLAFGILLRSSKKILGYLYDFGITCSHDEVRRFKKSAAVAATDTSIIQGIHKTSSGMTQGIVDNFDVDIHSPNGKLSTHSLGTIITQTPQESTNQSEVFIHRLKYDQRSTVISDDPLSEINLPKHPKMPAVSREPSTPQVAESQRISVRRADVLDYRFFKEVTSDPECPEYQGYNTQVCRDEGHSIHKKTNIVYLPLIDHPPADARTMKTAMLTVKMVTESTGQMFVVFTADQQLYKIAVHILWDNPTLFSNFYLRLGGMHLLMSYVGSIGTLMINTGLTEVLSAAFGGVLKMLNGKKFPENIRALRMLTECLLEPILTKESTIDMDGLYAILNKAASRTRTARLWVDCLIKPVFIILRYVRAEREGDWLLHLKCVEEMMPLFFAAGHFNYARYGLYYLRSMQDMDDDVKEHFLNGEHVIHLSDGVFNGIWSDMAIESTLMRYGHGPGGIVGVTLQPQTVKTWAYSMHACNELERSLDNLRNHEKMPSYKHKEEFPSRIKSDCRDREALREKLSVSIDPISTEQYAENLVNIATGQVIINNIVNVDKAIVIGQKQMKAFESSWPDGFHNPIKKVVKTMGIVKKHLKVGETKVYSTETIYARAMAMQNISDGLDIQTLLRYELSPHPASICDEHGMREAKTKSKLTNALKVEVSSRAFSPDGIFIDGCAFVWTVHWPKKGTIQDYLDNFRASLKEYLNSNVIVYLTFDRYYKDSLKAVTRVTRDKGASRVYNLHPGAKIPTQDAILTVTENKKQLIDLIVKDLLQHKEEIPSSLVVTGRESSPVEINMNTAIYRHDLKVMHEEADSTILFLIFKSSLPKVLVIADDADIFVLLCHFVFHRDITGQVYMDTPKKERKMKDINASVEKHHKIMPDLLAAHALTGCDTVAPYHGIGKLTALRILRTGKYSLSAVGDIYSTEAEICQQAGAFIRACYGQSNCNSMTEARHKEWIKKLSRISNEPPKLKDLPPTDEGFKPNALRGHLQVVDWKRSIESSRSALNPIQFGWMKDESLPYLVPQMVADGVALAPESLLRSLRCNCSSERPCRTNHCTCVAHSMACTPFCGCEGGSSCCNTKNIEDGNDADEPEQMEESDSDRESSL